MPRTLQLALSPYHLATREVPAMLALILGDRVVTLMPHPAAGSSREAVKEAVDRSPRYLRLMEAWRWSAPLWQSGVIASGADGEEAADTLESVYADIAEDESLAALRPLTRGAVQRAAESPDRSLDLLAADLLRGGPDPGINIPVCAALDRFAVDHGLCVVRAGASSVAQRAEARMGTRVFSIALPVLIRAGGGRIERLRDDLRKQLRPMREALLAIVESTLEADGTSPDAAALSAAADTFTRRFDAWAADGGASGDDENGERVVAGYVSVTGFVLPADAVLRSSRAAVHALQGSGGGGAGGRDDPSPISGADRRMFSLVVREMNVRPESAPGA